MLTHKQAQEGIDNLLIESLRAAEMRQGCTNHSYYAEILKKQILSLIFADDQTVELLSEKGGHDVVGQLLKEKLQNYTLIAVTRGAKAQASKMIQDRWAKVRK